MRTLEKTHTSNAVAVKNHWEVEAARAQMTPPPINESQLDDIDYDHVRFWSRLVAKTKRSFPDTVRVFRGQTTSDPRPNKDLFEVQRLTHPDITNTVTAWNSIVREGVTPRWLPDKPQRQTNRPPNHQSATKHDASIRRHLRKGQLEGRYLIVEANLLDQWPEIFISPLAVVDKPGVLKQDIRLINDYSFPPEASVNDYTDRSDHPPISYNPPRAIARRIHQLKQLSDAAYVLLMLGDVAGAFRHIPIHADSVHMFSFIYKDVFVVDLSCGFGWCGSPFYYAVAGKLINHLYEFGNQLNRQFTGNVWCDDHTCVEIDKGSRCFDANLALRRAMATVLGPTSLNEHKFTKWSTKTKSLGLLWDTEAGCVSIPADKIEKALGRVNQLITSKTASKSTLLKALGSLRHVATCSRPARAFFQRLQNNANRFARFGYLRKLAMIYAGSLPSFNNPIASTRFPSFTLPTCRSLTCMSLWTPAVRVFAVWNRPCIDSSGKSFRSTNQGIYQSM
jgi:hypothetical protein